MYISQKIRISSLKSKIKSSNLTVSPLMFFYRLLNQIFPVYRNSPKGFRLHLSFADAGQLLENVNKQEELNCITDRKSLTNL